MDTARRALVAVVAAIALVAGGACGGSGDASPSTERDASSGSGPAVAAPGFGVVIDDDGRRVLPNWQTPEEQATARTAPPPRAQAGEPPPAGYRIPAEYEPVSTVVMTWAGHGQVLTDVSVAAAAAGADVWMVGGPPSIPGVPAARYTAVPLGFDSIWSRDYGPVGIDEAADRLGIVDTTYRHHATRTDDDAMSCRLAAELGGDCFPTGLVLDGGNFMTDGNGNAFLTSRVYDWNASLTRDRVDELLRDYLGAEEIHILDYAKGPTGQPADGTGHIDMFAKLVGDCRVVVARTDDAPFAEVTEAAAAYFDDLACGTGTYDVTRVRGWVDDGVWHTYTNSLIVNDTVVIPAYGRLIDDRVAESAYRAAMPDHRVVGVDSRSTIVQGGSIHCVTREIPAVDASP